MPTPPCRKVVKKLSKNKLNMCYNVSILRNKRVDIDTKGGIFSKAQIKTLPHLFEHTGEMW